MKALVAAFNQEKALVGAFSVITNLRMDLFETLWQAAAAWVPAPVPASAANRLIGEVVQSRRRPLLGPSPG